MSQKALKRRRIQRRQMILSWIVGCAPFILSFIMMMVHGITGKIVLWLAGLSTIAWFVLTGGYIYALINKWEVVSLKKPAYYKGKPITPKEAKFFAYAYAVIPFAIGVLSAILFFKEMLA